MRIYCEDLLCRFIVRCLLRDRRQPTLLLKQDLELLSEQWLSGHKDLKYTSLEPPEKIVEHIKELGTYRAHI